MHVDVGMLPLDDAQQAVLRAEQLHHRDPVGVHPVGDRPVGGR